MFRLLPSVVAGDHCLCLTALSHGSSGRDSRRLCKLGALCPQVMVRRSFPIDVPLCGPRNQGSFSISQRFFVLQEKGISKLLFEAE